MEMTEKRIAEMFKALCDENRIKILKLLRSGEKCACHLNDEINVTQPTVSHHMKVLCDSGIVVGRKEGKWMHYSISPEGARLAADVLKELEGPFDFIFLDAAKAQYISMLPDIRRLLPQGGILLADNVLQDGELIRSRYLTPRRQRTIHERMREFIWEMKHSPDFETSLLTVGDGVILSIRKGA